MQPILTSFRKYGNREVQKMLNKAYVAGMHDALCIEIKKMQQKNLLDIVFDCAEESFGLTREELIRKTRDRDIVDARTIIYWIIYPNYGSLKEVGSIFHQDHSTVLNRLEKYSEFFSNDINFRNKAILFQSKFNEKLQSKIN